MRPTSARWQKVVRSSHKRVVRAKIVAPGQWGVSPTGTEIDLVSGDVTTDINADILSTLQVDCFYPWPTETTDLGTPYGSEIYVERGIEYGDGGTEWVGLGYYRIDTVEQNRTPNGSLHVGASDRMASIRDGRVITPVQFGAGASLSSVVNFVVTQVLPAAQIVYDFSASTTFLSISHFLQDDRLKFLKDLLASYGKYMYWDYAGRLQIKSVPNPTGQPVLTINNGSNGILVDMKRSLSREGVYNVVVASGQPAGEQSPVIGIAMDTVPTSPTYWLGPFTAVTKYFSSTFLQTNAQCVTAAQAELRKSIGLPYTVSLGMVPNPALEAGDVILVKYANRADTELHIADKIVYPLDTSTPMRIETRKQFL